MPGAPGAPSCDSLERGWIAQVEAIEFVSPLRGWKRFLSFTQG